MSSRKADNVLQEVNYLNCPNGLTYIHIALQKDNFKVRLLFNCFKKNAKVLTWKKLGNHCQSVDFVEASL